MDLENIADVLRKTNICVTTVGVGFMELECTQTEAELARDITRQMSTPVIKLRDTAFRPTDYPRTWMIEFEPTLEEKDDIHRRRSEFRKARTTAAENRLPSAPDGQSSDIQGNCGTDGTLDQVPGSL